jgi:Flp pilus assembly protein TadD
MRTPTTLKRLSALCAGAMLLACADVSHHATLRAPPLVAASADDAYAAGRNHHLAHRYDEAVRAYRAALAVDPHHVSARNALATIYAERREFAQAIPIWRALTEHVTLADGPGSAYLFSNLGYAYFLSGDYGRAVAALEKACLLDPFNQYAWYHLGESLQKLGQEERAQAMFGQAAMLQRHDLRADVAATGGSSLPAVAQAVQSVQGSPEREAGTWSSTELVTRADGLLELRRMAPPQALPTVTQSALRTAIEAAQQPAQSAWPSSTPGATLIASEVEVAGQVQTTPVPPPAERAPITAVVAPAPTAPLRDRLPVRAMPTLALLEIRNGNGVTGMAKALSLSMADPAFKVARLTNEKGFNVHQTRVEYQAGFRPAAERLAQRFDNATLVEVANCKKTDLRLVIGRDVARASFALRPLAVPAPQRIEDDVIVVAKGG